MKKSYTLHAENLLNTNKSIQLHNLINSEMDNTIPGKHIIQNLINYSKSLNIIKFQSIGCFGIIAN
ncbi:MAG: hypothetical protein NTZ33_07335 [Bacteroidetes bacterium]|nr:hypothetical protein [Bacteroidota bacterium]